MFTKGTSGNKNGRPVNSKNKVSQEIREKFKLLIDGNFEQIENDFKNLQPVEEIILPESIQIEDEVVPEVIVEPELHE